MMLVLLPLFFCCVLVCVRVCVRAWVCAAVQFPGENDAGVPMTGMVDVSK